MTSHKIVYPSLLSADFAYLAEELSYINNAEGIHFDVMDGHFVPNLSFGPSILKDVARITDLPFDVHLMVSCLDNVLHSFIQPQVKCITLHAEIEGVTKYFDIIQEHDIKIGISINPYTLLDEKVERLVCQVDQVLIMAVQPGFGGQSFIPSVLTKIQSIRALTPSPIIVDGGINLENAKLCYDHGADGVVAGTWIFQDHDRKAYNQRIKALQLNI